MEPSNTSWRWASASTYKFRFTATKSSPPDEIGYARVSKADGSQSLDLQRDALQAAGVDVGHVYHARGSASLSRDAPLLHPADHDAVRDLQWAHVT